MPEPDQDSLLFFCNARPFHDNPDCLVGLVPLARAGMNHAGGAQLSTPPPLCTTTTTCQFSPTGSHLLLLSYFYLPPSLLPHPLLFYLPAKQDTSVTQDIWQAGHLGEAKPPTLSRILSSTSHYSSFGWWQPISFISSLLYRIHPISYIQYI